MFITVFAEISAHQKQWFFKGGSTQNRLVVMGDFSKGGVHKTDWLWWVIFQRGEYTKPIGCDGWFFKGGSTQNRWVWEFYLLLLKIKRPGRLFWQIRCVVFFVTRKSFSWLRKRKFRWFASATIGTVRRCVVSLLTATIWSFNARDWNKFGYVGRMLCFLWKGLTFSCPNSFFFCIWFITESDWSIDENVAFSY